MQYIKSECNLVTLRAHKCLPELVNGWYTEVYNGHHVPDHGVQLLLNVSGLGVVIDGQEEKIYGECHELFHTKALGVNSSN